MSEARSAKKFQIKDLLPNVLSEKPSVFLATYTGIEPSQLLSLNNTQRERVFLGLWKQLDLAVSLHGPEAKAQLGKEVGNYFSVDAVKIEDIIPKINSLLVFGDIRNLEGSGVEHLHDRLAHFWRILGWEELKEIGAYDIGVKNHAVNLDPIVTSCGNLIRTLDLLSERWEESEDGPHLVFPLSTPRISKEESNGYRASRLETDHTNTLAVITGRNNNRPDSNTRLDFKEKGMILDRLLAKYPIEFAYAIFEYYAFIQNWDQKAYNVGLVQEYMINGKRRVKGLINGKMIVLHGQAQVGNDITIVNQQILASSLNDIVTGSPLRSSFTSFDVPIANGSVITLVQGETAAVIIGYPALVQTFNVAPGQIRKQVASFAAAIHTSNQEKPILTLPTGHVSEQKHVPVDRETLQIADEKILQYFREHNIQNVNIEAGHIHADTTATSRQKNGIVIGAQIGTFLEENGIQVRRTTMIDEDHVPNALDHDMYLKLMKLLEYNIDEPIFESSPVIREISISAIASLLSQYPESFGRNGNALIFNIPGTDLNVEVVKDVTTEPFELGCVIFDVGLTLYKINPELGLTYQNLNGDEVHNGMLRLYRETTDLKERLALVRNTYPYLTTKAEDIEKSRPLPPLENKNAAILNVLEGFYTLQQKKLEGILRALKIPILLIDVAFSHQGLQINLD